MITIIQYKQLTKEVPAKKYAYMVQFYQDKSEMSSVELDALGSRGWQVVSARRAATKDGEEYGYEYVLMKELPE